MSRRGIADTALKREKSASIQANNTFSEHNYIVQDPVIIRDGQNIVTAMAEQDKKRKRKAPCPRRVRKTSEEQETREANDRNKPLPHSILNKHENVYSIFMAALAAFFSPISSQIYFPALPILAQYYDKITTLISLTVTTYIIVQGIAPAFCWKFRRYQWPSTSLCPGFHYLHCSKHRSSYP